MGGDLFSSGDLTGFPKSRKRRGRQTALDDGSLFGARESLADFFGRNWAVIGWELRIARTVAQVRYAIKPLATFEPRVGLFVRDSISEAAAEDLRSIRKKLANLVAEMTATHSTFRIHEERYARANAALAQDPSDESLCELSADRLRQLECARTEVEAIVAKERSLREQLASKEAYFCQTELLKFIRSKRYAIVPISLANATAGLPYMRWRQSMKRCSRLQSNIANSFSYQIFKLIERILSQMDLLGERSLEVFEGLLRQSSDRDLAAVELKKNWYYLRPAIEIFTIGTHHPRSVPYAILAEYQRRLQRRSRRDMVLEEESRLC